MDYTISIPCGRNPLVARVIYEDGIIRVYEKNTGLLIAEVSREHQVGDCMFWYEHQPEITGVWWARKYCSYGGRAERGFHSRLICQVIYETIVLPKIKSGEIFPKSWRETGAVSTYGPGRVKRKQSEGGYTLTTSGGTNLAMFNSLGDLDRLAKTQNWGTLRHSTNYGDQSERIGEETRAALKILFDETYYSEWLRLHVVPTLGADLYDGVMERPYTFQHNRYYSACIKETWTKPVVTRDKQVNEFSGTLVGWEPWAVEHNGEFIRYSHSRDGFVVQDSVATICYPDDPNLSPVKYINDLTNDMVFVDGRDSINHVIRYHFDDPWVIMDRLELHSRLKELKIERLGDLVNWTLDGKRVCSIQLGGQDTSCSRF